MSKYLGGKGRVGREKGRPLRNPGKSNVRIIREEPAKTEIKRTRHFIKKGREQKEVRGNIPTGRRQHNRQMQSIINPEAEVDICNKNLRGTATPSAGRRTSKATLRAAHRYAIFKIF
ncbi:hypothetical protein N9L19_00625 [bacterium]|nr:hypothetical protein [bacterium]